MPIINSIKSELNETPCNKLSNGAKPYYWCTHSSDFIIVRMDQEITGNTFSLNNIFAADTLEELDAEILKKELK